MRQHFVILIGLSLLTIAVFAQVHDFDFIYLDDNLYLTDNPWIWDGFTGENVSRVFTSSQPGWLWQPLVWLTYMLDVELFGKNAGGFHLQNVAWHLANVLLVYAVVYGLTRESYRSAFVAALFAVHPLRVESVAWVTERKDVLSTFFGLLAIDAYRRWVQQAHRKWFWGAWLCMGCSLMAKQMLVTFPFVLLLLDHWPLRRHQSNDEESPAKPFIQLVIEKWPFFAMTVAFCMVAFNAQSSGGAVNSSQVMPVAFRLLNAVLVYGLYLWKMIWPIKLGIFYPHPNIAISMQAVVISGLALITMTIAAFRCSRKRPEFLVCWFWYLGTLVPVIGLVQVGAQQMADRFTYVPAIGIFIAIAWMLPLGATAAVNTRRITCIASAVCIVGLAILSHRQTSHWKDSYAIFGHTIEVTGENSLMHVCLSVPLQKENRHEEAIEHLREAVRIKPGQKLGHLNLGVSLSALGQMDEAEDAYREALEVDPGFAEAHNNLGNLFLSQMRWQDAIDEYYEALMLNPQLYDAQSNLSFVEPHFAALKKRLDLARVRVKQAPKNSDAHKQLAMALRDYGDFPRAVESFERAYELALDDKSLLQEVVLGHVQIGLMAAKNEDFDKAIVRFQKAQKHDPTAHEPKINMARTYRLKGQLDKATELYQQLIKERPRDVNVLLGYGKLLIDQNQNSQAEVHIKRALELNPKFKPARDALVRLRNSEVGAQ